MGVTIENGLLHFYIVVFFLIVNKYFIIANKLQSFYVDTNLVF